MRVWQACYRCCVLLKVSVVRRMTVACGEVCCPAAAASRVGKSKVVTLRPRSREQSTSR